MSMSKTSTSGSSVPDASSNSDSTICQLLPTVGCHNAPFPVPVDPPLGVALAGALETLLVAVPLGFPVEYGWALELTLGGVLVCPLACALECVLGLLLECRLGRTLEYGIGVALECGLEVAVECALGRELKCTVGCAVERTVECPLGAPP